MFSNFLKIAFVAILFLVFLSLGLRGFAITPQEERQALEEELKKLEQTIGQYEQDITKTQGEKRTLQNQITVLRKKIEKLNLQIQQSNVMIRDVKLQIVDTEGSIIRTSSEIEQSKERLGGVLRNIYEEDKKSFAEILLQGDDLSDFFGNVTFLEILNTENQELLKNIKGLKISLESQKESLDNEKDDLGRILKIQLLQKQDGQSTKSEKETLLDQTKGKESNYQKLLAETQKKAAEIRARIFELIGVPKAPTFGEAYDIAKYVETITGVRPAFLLAVLTQESNIGKNVGQCFLKNTATGDGVRIKNNEPVAKVMKPTRDLAPFLAITGELGRNPLETPVSCPMEYGWGGAMGPAQFLPSTWVLYKDRLKAVAGKPADPWGIKDAFLAAGLYLSDSGAAEKTYNSEWRAAMIYFSGSTNAKYKFYGDSVMKITSRYEEDIKELEKSR